jgi:MFS family permease
VRYAYLFQAFNTASFQIALGSPLILFAREIGAPASVLGILAGLTPLLATLQLPMAPVARRIGYRNLMFRGWGLRVLTLLWLTAMPFIYLLTSPFVAVALLVACMFLFNLVRGLGAGTWTPVIAALVPRSIRGEYLSRDRFFSAVAAVIALGISGVILSQHQITSYSWLFGMSFVVGAISLYFLRQVPDLTGAGQDNDLPMPEVVSWRSLWANINFRNYVVFSVVIQIALAASGSFSIVFAREEMGLTDGALVLITASGQIASMIGVLWLRPRMDTFGSKPFMRGVLVSWLVYFSIWGLMALRVLQFGAWLVPLLFIVNGFLAAVFEAPSTRLLMNSFGDLPGSAQFFTLHSVAVSLTAGFSPMLWGSVLDLLRYGVLSRFVYFYLAELVIIGVVIWLLRRVKEDY